jgi:F420H(2)-dependent quinone reductase
VPVTGTGEPLYIRTYRMRRALTDPRWRAGGRIAPMIEVKVERTPCVKGRSMSDKPERGPRLPPRWFIRLAWSVHRGLYRVTRGRVGLRRPRGNRWGTLRLTTTGRRTGRKHSVIIAYFEDGPNLIAMAMNGWADGEPAWWLNLQAHPDASVELGDGPRLVRARVAKGDERSRLWGRWREIDAKLDAYAALRSSETAVVILESRPEPGQ